MPPPYEGTCTTLEPLNHSDRIAVLSRQRVLLRLDLCLTAEDNTFQCWLRVFDRDLGWHVGIRGVADPLTGQRYLCLAELDARVGFHPGDKRVCGTGIRK